MSGAIRDYQAATPPNAPCWQCVIPSVCPVGDACPVHRRFAAEAKAAHDRARRAVMHGLSADKIYARASEKARAEYPNGCPSATELAQFVREAIEDLTAPGTKP